MRITGMRESGKFCKNNKFWINQIKECAIKTIKGDKTIHFKKIDNKWKKKVIKLEKTKKINLNYKGKITINSKYYVTNKIWESKRQLSFFKIGCISCGSREKLLLVNSESYIKSECNSEITELRKLRNRNKFCQCENCYNKGTDTVYGSEIMSIENLIKRTDSTHNKTWEEKGWLDINSTPKRINKINRRINMALPTDTVLLTEFATEKGYKAITLKKLLKEYNINIVKSKNEDYISRAEGEAVIRREEEIRRYKTIGKISIPSITAPSEEFRFPWVKPKLTIRDVDRIKNKVAAQEKEFEAFAEQAKKVKTPEQKIDFLGKLVLSDVTTENKEILIQMIEKIG
jgi:hypothetical protein